MWIYTLLEWIAATFVVVMLGLRWCYHERFCYFPTKQKGRYSTTPATYGFHYEDVSMVTKDGITLHGWWVPYERNSPVLVYSHGNAGNIESRAYEITCMSRVLHCNVLGYDYRGFGLSSPEQQPTHSGLRIDCETAVKFAKAKIENGEGTSLWMYGHSIGGGVAVDFVSTHQSEVSALILENTFISLQKMAMRILPSYIRFITPFAVQNTWRNSSLIKNIKTPTVIISGQVDDLIPKSDSEELYAKSGAERKEIIAVPNGNHIIDWMTDGNWVLEKVRQFIENSAHNPG